METNRIQESTPEDRFRRAERKRVRLNTPGLQFTRLRYLGGMTPMGWVWDLIYAHATVNDEDVHVDMEEAHQIRSKSKSLQELKYHLIQIGIYHNVHMVRAGLYNALSTLI
jgi:hypothetical protein